MKNQSMHTRCLVTAAVVTAALGVTACSSSKQSASYITSETTAAAAYDMEMSQNGAESYSSEMSPDSGGGLTSSSDTASVLPANRKLIRNATIEAETDQFEDLVNTITNQVSALGGYIQDSSVNGSSMTYGNEQRHRYASITARIPQEKLDSFITTVENNSNITNRYESTTDITLQYSDMESRKKSLTVEQDRIWALLEKADSLDSVIVLEKRLSEIRYELESMESQLRLYDNEVDYSTVSLSISEVTTYTPTAPESFGKRVQTGFSKNVSGVAAFLTGFVIWLIAASPIWLPLAIIAGVIFFIIQRRNAKNELKKLAINAAPDIFSTQGKESTQTENASEDTDEL